MPSQMTKKKEASPHPNTVADLIPSFNLGRNSCSAQEGHHQVTRELGSRPTIVGVIHRHQATLTSERVERPDGADGFLCESASFDDLVEHGKAKLAEERGDKSSRYPKDGDWKVLGGFSEACCPKKRNAKATH